MLCLRKMLLSLLSTQLTAIEWEGGETAGTKHRSQVIVLPIQKESQTLVKANLRPN